MEFCMHLKNITTLTAISAALVLVACGGGSDTVVPPAATTPTTTTPTTPTPTPTIIKGTAVKGPVTDAIVTVKKPVMVRFWPPPKRVQGVPTQ
jgi:ABC-type glycerol-3-phosphate transport system substrate-binding protein